MIPITFHTEWTLVASTCPPFLFLAGLLLLWLWKSHSMWLRGGWLCLSSFSQDSRGHAHHHESINALFHYVIYIGHLTFAKKIMMMGTNSTTMHCVPGTISSLLLLLVTQSSVVSTSLRLHGLWPARFLCPWDFSGKNTGVGCHFLHWAVSSLP